MRLAWLGEEMALERGKITVVFQGLQGSYQVDKSQIFHGGARRDDETPH